MKVSKQAAVTPDYAAIKAKQCATWGSGDYARVGSTLQVTGEHLAEALDLSAGEDVLDVAAGNGNMTLAAARRFSRVVSTDYVEGLLERGKDRVKANGFDVEFKYADAEELPFDKGQFDHVVSTFGVMFAPDQPRCADELQRVCRPGGKIGMANWTPDGFIGEVFKVIGLHVAPPAGIQSPARWGTESFVKEQFFDQASHIAFNLRDFVFRYESPRHWLHIFRTYYGPILKAFEALDQDTGAALETDLLQLIGEFNTATNGSMRVPSQYAEIVITMLPGR